MTGQSFSIGPYSCSGPETEAVDLILRMLAALPGGAVEFECDPHRLHRFFKSVKDDYPTLLADVFFTDDDDFPYSSQINDAFSLLEEAAYLMRPDPWTQRFQLTARLSDKLDGLPEADRTGLKELADRFSQEFVPYR